MLIEANKVESLTQTVQIKQLSSTSSAQNALTETSDK